MKILDPFLPDCWSFAGHLLVRDFQKLCKNIQFSHRKMSQLACWHSIILYISLLSRVSRCINCTVWSVLPDCLLVLNQICCTKLSPAQTWKKCSLFSVKKQSSPFCFVKTLHCLTFHHRFWKWSLLELCAKERGVVSKWSGTVCSTAKSALRRIQESAASHIASNQLSVSLFWYDSFETRGSVGEIVQTGFVLVSQCLVSQFDTPIHNPHKFMQ